MKFTTAVLGLAISTKALALCPYAARALEDPEFVAEHIQKRDVPKTNEQHEKRQSGPGGLPFTTFNEDQLIDVTGDHAWVAPGPNDIRGPCPGLNALANHGYFPHSGVVPLATGASATEEVYGESYHPNCRHVILTKIRSCSELWNSVDRVCHACRWRCCVRDLLIRGCTLDADTTPVTNHGVSEANNLRL